MQFYQLGGPPGGLRGPFQRPAGRRPNPSFPPFRKAGARLAGWASRSTGASAISRRRPSPTGSGPEPRPRPPTSGASSPRASATASRCTGRRGSTTTSAWSMGACCSPGPFPGAPPWTRPASGWPSRPRTTPSTTATSRGSSHPGTAWGRWRLWDAGTFSWTRESAQDPDAQIARGDIKFRLSGEKLAGEFALVRIVDRAPRSAGAAEAQRSFLLIKKRDEAALDGHDAADHDGSVKSGRTLDAIAAQGGGDPRERDRARRRSAREAAHAPAGSVHAAPVRPPAPATAPAAPPPAVHPGLDPEIEQALEELPRLGGGGTWRIGPRRLRLTNLDKPLWPDPVITKRQMIDYYVRMSPTCCPISGAGRSPCRSSPTGSRGTPSGARTSRRTPRNG